MARLRVRVTPKAGSDSVSGREAGELRVKVKAAPEGGKANASVCAAVAGFLGVPKSHVSLVRGGSGRHKVLDIDGWPQDHLEAELDRLLGPGSG